MIGESVANHILRRSGVVGQAGKPVQEGERNRDAEQRGAMIVRGQILMGALMPHPPIVVPEVGGRELARVAATRQAMQEVARRVAESQPEVLIVFSPHAPAMWDAIPLLAPARFRGSLAGFGHPEVAMEWDPDGELIRAISREAEARQVPVRLLDEQHILRQTDSTLDHGLAVPLYYLARAGVECRLAATGIGFLGRDQLVVFGEAVRTAVAGLGRRAVLVASGDLSHRLQPGAPAGYHPDAHLFDERLVQALREDNRQAVLEIEEQLAEKAGECGFRPLLMLLGALAGTGLRPHVRSYEGPFGVGYAVVEWASPPSWPVRLALQSLETYLREGRVLAPPPDVPPELPERAGAFVSLKKAGELRGCIGTIEPTRMNLGEEIVYNAISAGTRDPRFPPVRLEELPELECSVDVLEPAEPVHGFGELDPRRYGVIVRKGHRTGLLLPDLEGVDTVEQQVAIARQKAGIRPGEGDVELFRFRVTRYR